MNSVFVCCGRLRSGEDCIHEYPELPFYCCDCGCKEFRKVGIASGKRDNKEYQLIKKDLFG